MPRTGVLLLGFGGPDSLESVEPFMCNLMGRQPSTELVERICANYEAIGGASPLVDIATRIADKLETDLAELGHDVPVRVGMRYWHPYIDATIADLAALGCDRIVTVSLSPFESKVTSGAYREAIDAGVDELGDIEVVEAPLLSELVEFADLHAEATEIALSGLPPTTSTVVAFTAHSLPESDLVGNDPYLVGLRAIASAVASRLDFAPGHEQAGEPVLPGFESFGAAEGAQPWFLVYQSKGARPGAWLGPALDDLMAAAAAGGTKAVVVSPIGFATDHMETLFDLDIVAARTAAAEGLSFVRAPVPNDDERLVAALARAVAPLV